VSLGDLDETMGAGVAPIGDDMALAGSARDSLVQAVTLPSASSVLRLRRQALLTYCA